MIFLIRRKRFAARTLSATRLNLYKPLDLQGCTSAVLCETGPFIEANVQAFWEATL